MLQAFFILPLSQKILPLWLIPLLNQSSMKQIWAALLLFVLLLQSYGAIWLYCFAVQPYCRYQTQKMPSTSVTLFKFRVDEAAQQLKWQHPNEFIYQHKLYDVKQQHTTNDTLYLSAHFDGLETHWLAYFNQYWQNLNPSIPTSNNKTLPLALNCLLSVYIIPQILSLLPPIGNIQPVNSSYLRLYTLFYPSVDFPPPQKV